MDNHYKTKTIRDIETKLDELDPSSLRYKVLETAKNFKTSWIALGQALYTVWKDKYFKEWGYSEFDNFTRKEIGIRSQTALKLLRSYNFMEAEEPKYISSEYTHKTETSRIPTLDSVDLIRKASRKKDLDADDYKKLKEKALDKGLDSKDLSKNMTLMIKKHPRNALAADPIAQKTIHLKKMITLLKKTKAELLSSEIVPEDLLEQAETVLTRLEATLNDYIGHN